MFGGKNDCFSKSLVLVMASRVIVMPLRIFLMSASVGFWVLSSRLSRSVAVSAGLNEWGRLAGDFWVMLPFSTKSRAQRRTDFSITPMGS